MLFAQSLIGPQVSYKAVGINASRIFIIDPRGNVKITNSQFTSTYVKLNDIVDQLFPPVTLQRGAISTYSDFSYWRSPMPQLSSKDLTL